MAETSLDAIREAWTAHTTEKERDENEYRMWREDQMESLGVKAAFMYALRPGRRQSNALLAPQRTLS